MLHHAVHEHFDDDLPMNRRGFLRGLTGILAAPAIVRVSALMPVKTIQPVYEWYPMYAGYETTLPMVEMLNARINEAFAITAKRWADHYMLNGDGSPHLLGDI